MSGDLYVGGEKVAEVSSFFGLPIVTDPVDPDTRYVISPAQIAAVFDVPPSLLSHPMLEDYDQMRWKVRAEYRDFSLMLDRMIVALCTYEDSVLHATNSTHDFEWMFHWYRDPGSAWWEQ